MANAVGKLKKAQGEYASAGKNLKAASGHGSAATNDDHLDERRHDRGYNPVDEAPRGNTSAALNADSAQYRKAPADV
jgi:hypothetical protein